MKVLLLFQEANADNLWGVIIVFARGTTTAYIHLYSLRQLHNIFSNTVYKGMKWGQSNSNQILMCLSIHLQMSD